MEIFGHIMLSLDPQGRCWVRSLVAKLLKVSKIIFDRYQLTLLRFKKSYGLEHERSKAGQRRDVLQLRVEEVAYEGKFMNLSRNPDEKITV